MTDLLSCRTQSYFGAENLLLLFSNWSCYVHCEFLCNNPSTLWKLKLKLHICLLPVGISLQSHHHRILNVFQVLSQQYIPMVAQMLITSVSRKWGCKGGTGAITISLFSSKGQDEKLQLPVSLSVQMDTLVFLCVTPSYLHGPIRHTIDFNTIQTINVEAPSRLIQLNRDSSWKLHHPPPQTVKAAGDGRSYSRFLRFFWNHGSDGHRTFLSCRPSSGFLISR